MQTRLLISEQVQRGFAKNIADPIVSRQTASKCVLILSIIPARSDYQPIYQFIKLLERRDEFRGEFCGERNRGTISELARVADQRENPLPSQ